MKFFYLQKSDRRIIVTLLCVIGVALTAFWLTDGRQEPAEHTPTASPSHASRYSPGTPRDSQRVSRNKPRTSHPNYYYQGEPPQPRLFPFDPNTADSTVLLQLGLKPWQVRNIYRYRAAGGVFHRPRDFARLYGLSLKDYQRLEPYIKIKKEEMAADHFSQKEEPAEKHDTLRYPVKLQPQERIVLNLADTTALRQVPGIGPYYARKIVAYRQRLGGFYSVQQLLEIEDFPEKAIRYFIIPDSTLPTPYVEINHWKLSQLKRHPYINFYQARAITDYRRTHGAIGSLQELSFCPDFPPEAISRLEPYVKY